jgi:hypothetical protein
MWSLLLRSLAAGKLSGLRKEGDCYDFAIANYITLLINFKFPQAIF